MLIVSGFAVPKMNPTSHGGNIRLRRPVVVAVEHQEDSQTENDKTYGEEKPDDILAYSVRGRFHPTPCTSPESFCVHHRSCH